MKEGRKEAKKKKETERNRNRVTKRTKRRTGKKNQKKGIFLIFFYFIFSLKMKYLARVQYIHLKLLQKILDRHLNGKVRKKINKKE